MVDFLIRQEEYFFGFFDLSLERTGNTEILYRKTLLLLGETPMALFCL